MNRASADFLPRHDQHQRASDEPRLIVPYHSAIGLGAIQEKLPLPFDSCESVVLPACPIPIRDSAYNMPGPGREASAEFEKNCRKWASGRYLPFEGRVASRLEPS